MRGREFFEFPMERTGVRGQGLEIARGVIGLALLPAGKVNAYQFVGQRAASLVMLVLVTLLLLLVIALGPGFLLERAAGIFVEGLPTELGTAVADMHRPGVAALHHHGGDAIEFSDIGGALEALAVGAKSHQDSGRERGPRPREASKDGRVGMLIHGLLD